MSKKVFIKTLGCQMNVYDSARIKEVLLQKRSGKKSSPLDEIRPRVWTREFTRELLELLWVLEHTVAGYPEQKRLLEDVLEGDLFKADELPEVPDAAREAPKVKRAPVGQTELDL